ncbi:MAG: response regulator [Syntrophomonadaceae bacterium]|nr:response regulator [Syntrophomonadaceae bacterium]
MKILLIDDDADCLASLDSMLEPAGHQCTLFTVPEEAVEICQQQHYDLVITDMKMPGMDGIEVLKKIRELSPETKVIIITAYGDVTTAVEAVNNQAYAFFGKPLQINDLMQTIEKIETEKIQHDKSTSDHAHLIMEYSRLKLAYQDLLALLQQKDGK